MPDLDNLLAAIPASLTEELVQILVRAPGVQVVRVVSCGHHSPDGFWYDQEENEFVVVVAGAARMVFEEPAETVEMVAGSFVNIAAHRRHRVEWTDPEQNTVWLGVFY